MFKTHNAFSSKAELYARYRWDYAPEAVAAILERSGLNQRSVAADIAAGTGILSRHLAGKAGLLLALEPNAEMRSMAARELAQKRGCGLVAATAEASGLKTAALDLICVAQAIHWFDPPAARQEFQRILKPGGWLAILHNFTQESQPRQQAMDAFHTPEFGVNFSVRPVGSGIEPEFYFGRGRFERLSFGFVSRQTWDEFLGALLSASYTPDPGQAPYPAYERAARAVFDRFSVDGVLETVCGTQLFLGQPG